MTENEKYVDYLNMLRKPFQKLVRLRFLQPDGSTAFILDNRSKGPYGGAFIADGTITHQWQNGRRTNATVTLDNVDGSFDYAYNNIWFGQEIALDEGLILSDGVTEYYIQQGIFLIENPSETVNPNQRTIVYNLVDKSAALDGTLGGNLDATYQVLVGTNIFTPIVSLLAEDKGNGYPIDHVKPIFTEYYNGKTQMLPDGTTANMTDAPYTLTIDGTDGTIWDVCAGLAGMVNGWIGYDEAGALRIDPSQDDILDTDKPISWEFSMNEAELIGLTYTARNTDVYNDYICIGEAIGDGIQPSGRAQILDPRSPVDINAIGRKTLRISQAGFGTNRQCQDYAAWQVKRAAVLRMSVNISCSQILHIRGNELVALVRTDKPGKPMERHLINGFTRPLAYNGEMTISAVSVNDFPIATVTYAGAIAAVPTQDGTLTYSGSLQSPTWMNFDTSQLAISGTMSGTNAGEYIVSFTPINGFAWWDGTDTAKSATWSIWRASLAVPTVTGTYTYNTSAQTVTIVGFDSTKMSKSGTETATNAGNYTLTFSILDTTNYQWSDGTVSAKNVTWSISKLQVTKPTISGSFVYDGSAKSATISGFNSTYMSKTGPESATNAGNYTVVVSLLNTANTAWVGGSTNAIALVWSIGKATPAVPTLSKYSATIYDGGTTTFTVTRTGDGAVIASTSNPNIATASVSGTTVTVTGIGFGSANITITVAEGTNYKAYTGSGAKCSVTSTADTTKCLTFSSPSDFTLEAAYKRWNGTLEWANDNQKWTLWDGAKKLNSGNKKLYLRGTGNTLVKSFRLTGQSITCSGNIETLLDYATVANGGHPSMDVDCFSYLFANNPALISGPSLPAMTLTSSCYYAMFYNCTSLQRLSAIPATTLGSWSCQRMYAGCTNIKVSETQTVEYQYPYRIPTSGTTTSPEPDALLYMFYATGGTFTGPENANTTYYTTAPPVT